MLFETVEQFSKEGFNKLKLKMAAEKIAGKKIFEPEGIIGCTSKEI